MTRSMGGHGTRMDRQQWLEEKRRNAVTRYDTIFALVAAYLRQVGLKVISREYGDDYWHYLCAKE